MQEKQVSAGSWVLHSIFNEVDDSVAFELRETAKAKVTWKRKYAFFVLDSNSGIATKMDFLFLFAWIEIPGITFFHSAHVTVHCWAATVAQN